MVCSSQVSQDGVSTTTTVSNSSRRTALDAASLLERSREEVVAIKLEMVNVIDHHLDSHRIIKLKWDDSISNNNRQAGMRCILAKKLAIVEMRLKEIVKNFVSFGVQTGELPSRFCDQYERSLLEHGTTVSVCSSSEDEHISEGSCDSD